MYIVFNLAGRRRKRVASSQPAPAGKVAREQPATSWPRCSRACAREDETDGTDEDEADADDRE